MLPLNLNPKFLEKYIKSSLLPSKVYWNLY